MSTKAIRKALEGLRGDFLWSEERTKETDAALSELAAIERAAKVLGDCQISYDRGVTKTEDAKAAHGLLHSIAKDAP